MAAPRQGKSSREKSQDHIDSIRTSKILKRLDKHALGKIKMESTQVRAAEILLKKTLPDLKVTEHTTDPAAPPVYRVIRSKEY